MKDLLDSASEKLNFYLSNEPVIEVVEKAATKAAYITSGATVYFGFTAEEWGILFGAGGFLLGFATCIFNAWFRMKYGRGNKNDE